MKKNLLIAVMAFVGLGLMTSCGNKMEKSKANLQEAFNGESTASAKYAAYAEQAKADSNLQVAALFEAAAYAEGLHAENLKQTLIALGVENPEAVIGAFEAKTTAENIQDAINGEQYELGEMYPKFIEEAKAEKCEAAIQPFQWALDTEMKHHQFYTTALQAISDTTIVLPFVYTVCAKCGNTFVAGQEEAQCPFCGMAKETFVSFGTAP
ncbi:MAG: ferritin family protein, partial [Bacteroidales bacterium]